MHKLLIATNNIGKIKELQNLLLDASIELVTPSQVNLHLDVLEDGHTYAENATKKAIAFAEASNLVSLADDSGLEVDALNGAPGLYSARYGPSLTLPAVSEKMGGARVVLTDRDRRLYLLENLEDKPRPWAARFRATIAIASPNRDIHLAEGTCEGEIIPEERGTGGFGYDPIFLLQGLGKTMAELSMEEKNRLSHRARAVLKAKPILKQLFNQT